MHVLAILTHPSQDSFDAAIFRTATDALREKGRTAIATELQTFFAGMTGRKEAAR